MPTGFYGLRFQQWIVTPRAESFECSFPLPSDAASVSGEPLECISAGTQRVYLRYSYRGGRSGESQSHRARTAPMSERISPLAGQPARATPLVDVSKLVDAYYRRRPDPAMPAQRVAFGTSGHRGSSFGASFN